MYFVKIQCNLLHQALVVARGPLHREWGVLATEPPGKSLQLHALTAPSLCGLVLLPVLPSFNYELHGSTSMSH